MATLVDSTLQPHAASTCINRTNECNEVAVFDGESDCRTEALEAMRAHPALQTRMKDVTLQFSGRCLELGGQLPSYYLKQMAQESLRNFSVARGLNIRNEIAVLKVHEAFETRELR